jgi:lipid II:glycine glycyltransferase (peptidoglycan interpeptide bridge formation enzyme)
MTLSLRWDTLDRPSWEALFATAGRTPLTQSWAYGEAKRAEGWRVRRALLVKDETPLALAQVLERRIAGLLRVGRLNRGPVWLAPPEREELCFALRGLAAPWRPWRGGVFLCAPELGAEAAPLLASLGFRRRGAPAWCSAWLNLAPEPEQLRRQLDGKWRNMLVGAEKAGLSVDISHQAESLDWLMEQYRTLMADKGFGGAPPSLIARLRENAHAPGDLTVLRALTPTGEAVGGILLARHGDTATYLVGWNGDAGRRMKAGNLLLWTAMLFLRGQGCRLLDLGGIDEVLTPGIAAFKRGMKGEEYLLAGEFLRL